MKRLMKAIIKTLLEFILIAIVSVFITLLLQDMPMIAGLCIVLSIAFVVLVYANFKLKE